MPNIFTNLQSSFKERNASYYIHRATDNKGLNKKVRLQKRFLVYGVS
jgi:hypothetical protein